MRTAAALAAALLLPATCLAHRMLVHDTYGVPVIIDTDTDAVLSSGGPVIGLVRDIVIDVEGVIYGAAHDVVQYRLDSLNAQLLIDPGPDTLSDIAFFSDGSLAAGSDLGTADAMYRVTTDGVVLERIPAPPGFSFIGMTVPKSGPAEDDILAIVSEGPSPGPGYHYLVRYSRGPSMVFAPGPLVPLSDLSVQTCATDAHDNPGQPMARADGESFLILDDCAEDVKHYSLDGTYLGVFASLPRDLSLPPVPGGNRFDEHLRNITVLPDDTVFILSSRQAHHYDAVGNRIATVDHLFTEATCADLLDWVPFEGGTGTCEPAGLGYWKRQCLGWDSGARSQRRSRAPSAPLSRVPSGALRPGVHPSLRLDVIDDIFAAANARMTAYEVTACQALWPADPSDPRARALMHLAPAILNHAAKHLRPTCWVHIDGADMQVRDVRAIIDTLLAQDTDESNREAARLAERLHTATEGP